jgi:tetratricopeptide (TPR) repeat protein
MNTTKSIRTITLEGPARQLLLDGIRELSRGNELAALETFSRALDGDASIGALCTARLRLLRREHAKAQEGLEALIEREPGLAEAHFLIGTAHRGQFRTPEAIRSFREALRLDPGHARAALELADLLDVQEP